MPLGTNSVELRVNGLAYRDCVSYSADSDLFQAGDTFSFTLRSDLPLPPQGARCEMYLNGVRELTGILDRRTRRIEKGAATVTLEGRDLLGLLVDSQVEELIDLTNISLKGLAERLLRPIPFIQRKDIAFQDGTAPVVSEDLERAPHAEPGDSVFDVLSRAAKARGLLFYSEPGGQLVFGRPLAKGTPAGKIYHRRVDQRNNALDSSFEDDISKRFKKVIVIGQKDDDDVEVANVLAIVTDPTFPFYKACVIEMPHDVADAHAFGRLELAKQRAAGFRLRYNVSGFTAEGKNWTPNTLVLVDDEWNDIAGLYLIYGRTFRRDKKNGDRTELRLGLPGVLQ